MLNLKLNNDCLLQWYVCPVVGWALWGLVLGIPIHVALGIHSSSIALFFTIQCALQIAMTSWLFAARGAAGNPQDQVLRRTKAVIARTLGFEASGAACAEFKASAQESMRATRYLIRYILSMRASDRGAAQGRI